MIQMNSLECLMMNTVKCFNKKERKKNWIKKLSISKQQKKKIEYLKNQEIKKKVLVIVFNLRMKIIVIKVLKIHNKRIAAFLQKKGVEVLVYQIKMLKIFKNSKYNN